MNITDILKGITPIKPRELYTVEEWESIINNLEGTRDSLCAINLELNKRIEERDSTIATQKLELEYLKSRTRLDRFSKFMRLNLSWIRWICGTPTVIYIVQKLVG